MRSDPIKVQSPERIAQRMRYLAKQWDAVARALGADADDPDAVLAAAKAKQASAPVGVEDREIAEHDQFAAIVNALHGAGESMERAVVLARIVTEALAQQPAAVDGAVTGWSLRHERGMIRVIGPDGRSYAAVDPSLAGQQQGGTPE